VFIFLFSADLNEIIKDLNNLKEANVRDACFLLVLLRHTQLPCNLSPNCASKDESLCHLLFQLACLARGSRAKTLHFLGLRQFTSEYLLKSRRNKAREERQVCIFSLDAHLMLFANIYLMRTLLLANRPFAAALLS